MSIYIGMNNQQNSAKAKNRYAWQGLVWNRLLPHNEEKPFTEHNAAENKQYAENIADCYIYQGSFPITDLEELKCFPGKSGKGCKTTQKAGKDKEAPLMGPVGFIEQAPDEADEKRPQEVNGKCSGRKGRSRITLDKEKHAVAASGSDRASGHDS